MASSSSMCMRRIVISFGMMDSCCRWRVQTPHYCARNRQKDQIEDSTFGHGHEICYKLIMRSVCAMMAHTHSVEL